MSEKVDGSSRSLGEVTSEPVRSKVDTFSYIRDRAIVQDRKTNAASQRVEPKKCTACGWTGLGPVQPARIPCPRCRSPAGPLTDPAEREDYEARARAALLRERSAIAAKYGATGRTLFSGPVPIGREDR
ncbi:MAG: hypothetical protein QMD46_12360 [Methanomicrobiales archaeon]|nr:hypothetical protein [Methanomicrobiales archaeon]